MKKMHKKAGENMLKKQTASAVRLLLFHFQLSIDNLLLSLA